MEEKTATPAGQRRDVLVSSPATLYWKIVPILFSPWRGTNSGRRQGALRLDLTTWETQKTPLSVAACRPEAEHHSTLLVRGRAGLGWAARATRLRGLFDVTWTSVAWAGWLGASCTSCAAGIDPRDSNRGVRR